MVAIHPSRETLRFGIVKMHESRRLVAERLIEPDLQMLARHHVTSDLHPVPVDNPHRQQA